MSSLKKLCLNISQRSGGKKVGGNSDSGIYGHVGSNVQVGENSSSVAGRVTGKQGEEFGFFN